MTLLALVRHGETEWNREGRIQGTSDVPLNDTGRAQAAQAAERLGADPFEREWFGVITSPLSRARETGHLIARTLAVPLLAAMPGLTERDYGRGDGMTIAEARFQHPDGDYPRSESDDRVLERALASIDAIQSRHPQRSLIVVSHGGLLHTLLSRLNGSRVPAILNGTINLIEFAQESGGWAVRAINSEPHQLQGAQGR